MNLWIMGFDTKDKGQGDGFFSRKFYLKWTFDWVVNRDFFGYREYALLFDQ
jgi:hypothetical protein